MAEPLRPSIFISYAHKDGAALAQYLQSALMQEGFDAWLDTRRLYGGAVWSFEIEREIDTRQVTIALMSPGSYASEICRGEQLIALDKGKRVIPVLAVKGTDRDRPVYLYARQYLDFTDAANYSARLTELIADIRGETTATVPDSYRKTPVTYLTVPPRVANYIPRTQAVRALRNALFAEDHRQPIALTALAGMGGIGKTVLAKALTEDEVVQRAFPDGIVWIAAGKERKRDFIEEMREVAKTLGDDLSAYDTALACEHQYRTTIANKAALIVVDDVWSKADIEPLLAESPRSRFLFTTRDASIGRFVSARAHRADLLDVAQSRKLLAGWANVPVAELPQVADEIVGECGRLPLALSVVGAMLQGADAPFWKDTLDLLRRADLSAIQEQLPEGQQSFFRAVEVSFQSLKPEMQERYTALAVLLEDMVAPLPILQTLWNASEAEARRISKRFVDLSLAQTDSALESIRLHDLQLDYVRAAYPGRGSLELIHAAFRLSEHVLENDPTQFASQLVGRLLPYRDESAIRRFCDRICASMRPPWFLPLHPALHPPGAGLVRILEGHAGALNDVAVSGDGRLAVSASDDYTLKVWDLESGHELNTLDEHDGPVNAVILGADERTAVSSSSDGTIRVWDLEKFCTAMVLSGRSKSGQGVPASIDWSRVIAASGEPSLHEWHPERAQEAQNEAANSIDHWDYIFGGVEVSYEDELLEREMSIDEEEAEAERAEAGFDFDDDRWPEDILNNTESRDSRATEPEFSELTTIGGDSDEVFGLAVSESDPVLWSALADGTIRVWNLRTSREVRTLEGHTGRVNTLATSNEGGLLVSGSCDKTLKLWDLKTNLLAKTLEGHSAWVNKVAVGPDGATVVSASNDGTLKVWDLQTGHVQTLEGHLGPVHCVAVAPKRRTAVSGGTDGLLKVWDLDTGLLIDSLEGHSGPVRGVAVSSDGSRIVSASDDRTLRVWEWKNSTAISKPAHHSGLVLDIALRRSKPTAVSASGDRTLRVWDIDTGELRHTLSGHSNRITGVALSADGRVVSASLDGILKVWDVEEGREECTFADSAGIIGLAISANGRWLVSASLNETARIWNVDRRSVLRSFPCWPGRLRGVAISDDGARALLTSSSSTLSVRDVPSGKEVGILFGTFGDVVPLALSADGQRALSVSTDDTIDVWDVQRSRVVVRLSGHSDSVWAVAISPDGQTGVSASLDRTVCAWDLRTGAAFATFTCDAAALCCRFDGGENVVAGDSGGRLYFLRLIR